MVVITDKTAVAAVGGCSCIARRYRAGGGSSRRRSGHLGAGGRLLRVPRGLPSRLPSLHRQVFKPRTTPPQSAGPTRHLVSHGAQPGQGPAWKPSTCRASGPHRGVGRDLPAVRSGEALPAGESDFGQVVPEAESTTGSRHKYQRCYECGKQSKWYHLGQILVRSRPDRTAATCKLGEKVSRQACIPCRSS